MQMTTSKSVLEMMASDMKWTRELGEAFLTQQQDVMDAIQRIRQEGRITAICAATTKSS
jgi:hypothetical protein